MGSKKFFRTWGFVGLLGCSLLFLSHCDTQKLDECKTSVGSCDKEKKDCDPKLKNLKAEVASLEQGLGPLKEEVEGLKKESGIQQALLDEGTASCKPFAKARSEAKPKIGSVLGGKLAK